MARRNSKPILTRIPLLLAALFSAAPILFAFWYSRQDAATQEQLQLQLLRLIDRLRESDAAPPTLQYWLDLLADALPVSFGRVVPLPAPVARDAYAFAGLPASPSRLRPLLNPGFILAYDEDLHCPVWTAYRLQKQQNWNAPERPANFQVDVRTSSRVTSADFSGSGYDRGHLAPNYAIAINYGPAAQADTFLLSNIFPQDPVLNRGLWSRLEQRIARRYASRYEEVWVLAGTTFRRPPQRLPSGLAVPEQLFLIVVDEVKGQGIRAQAFLVPNEPPEEDRPALYLTSIDIIETHTGLDFFPLLPAETEAALESAISVRLW